MVTQIQVVASRGIAFTRYEHSKTAIQLFYIWQYIKLFNSIQLFIDISCCNNIGLKLLKVKSQHEPWKGAASTLINIA